MGARRYEGTIAKSSMSEDGRTYKLKLEVEQIAYHDTLSSVLENKDYSFVVMNDRHLDPASSYSIKGGVCCAYIPPFEVTWDQSSKELSSARFSSLNISEDGLEVYFGGRSCTDVPWSTMELVSHDPDVDDD